MAIEKLLEILMICKINVNGISHYFNLIEGKLIDLTSSQFNGNIDYSNYQVVDREKIVNGDTKNRYNCLNLLKYGVRFV